MIKSSPLISTAKMATKPLPMPL